MKEIPVLGDFLASESGLLGIYLNDHRAGAAAGVVTARRCRTSNSGSELSEFLSAMLVELDVDIDLLDDVRNAIGAHSAAVKRAGSAIGAHLGRLKPNGRVVSYSPLSRVLELDLLIAGVKSKRTMWRTLDDLGESLDVLAPFEFDQPIERADRQIDALARFHRDAVRIAFS